MKKLIFSLILVLSGCKAASPNQTIVTHQPLQTTNTLDTASDQTFNEDLSINPTTFTTQQEFVDYMYENIRSLEDTLALLNSNLTQIIESEDDPSLLNEIRQKLINQTQLESETIKNLTPINEHVDNLHHYVIQSYFYNLENKIAQFDIFQTESLAERQTLLDANLENERLATHYLGLAWQELNRLSETSFYRK